MNKYKRNNLPPQTLENIIGFDWDHGNHEKNWIKHRVSKGECEEIFFNYPLLLVEDTEHSKIESRTQALGQTDMGRQLFVVFTLRQQLIRIISARGMNQRERDIYEKAKKNTEV